MRRMRRRRMTETPRMPMGVRPSDTPLHTPWVPYRTWRARGWQGGSPGGGGGEWRRRRRRTPGTGGRRWRGCTPAPGFRAPLCCRSNRPALWKQQTTNVTGVRWKHSSSLNLNYLLYLLLVCLEILYLQVFITGFQFMANKQFRMEKILGTSVCADISQYALKNQYVQFV